MAKKVCKKCGGEDFVPNGKRGTRCSPCNQKRNLKSYYENKETILLKQASWYLLNKDKVRERQKVYEQTSEYKENKARWSRNNKQYKRFESSKRRASVSNRTPSWADMGYIKLFYKLAKYEEGRTRRAVEVDHIVPLRGKYVSGLHCEHNLQLLFKEDNRSKGNRHAA